MPHPVFVLFTLLKMDAVKVRLFLRPAAQKMLQRCESQQNELHQTVETCVIETASSKQVVSFPTLL